MENFSLVCEYSDADSAKVFFNNLNELPGLNYEEAAHPVLKNQVWAVKTVQGNYGKILVLDSKAYKDNSNPEQPIPFGEATFLWEYQPNESNEF